MIEEIPQFINSLFKLLNQMLHYADPKLLLRNTEIFLYRVYLPETFHDVVAYKIY